VTFIATWVDLQANKVSKTNPVVNGSNVTYELSVTNNNWVTDPGPQWLTDTWPSNQTFVGFTPNGWSCNPNPPPPAGPLVCTLSGTPLLVGGTTPTITLVLKAPTYFTQTVGGFITNTVAVSGTLGDPFPLNNSTTVSTAVTFNTDMAIFKSGPSAIDSGNNYQYTVHVVNNGPSVATGVRVTDTMPVPIFGTPSGPNWINCTTSGSQVSCQYGLQLAVGATSSDLVITGTAPDINGPVVNTAVVGSDEFETQPANNTASFTTTVNTCHTNIVDPNQSHVQVVTPPGPNVGADSTSKGIIAVTLYDTCGQLIQAPSDAELITLTSSRGAADTITVASANPTTTGQVQFHVQSSTIGTGTYTAVAKNSVTGATVTIVQTANLNFQDDCVSISTPGLAGSQQFLKFTVANNNSVNGTILTRHLTSLTLTWPQRNGRHITGLTMATTTLWSGQGNNSPVTFGSGGTAFNVGTDPARTLGSGASASLQLNFNYSINPGDGEVYTLSTTWDDGTGGHVCSKAFSFTS
jgi:uncharacterized repeat protein (TIGR01451 family)